VCVALCLFVKKSAKNIAYIVLIAKFYIKEHVIVTYKYATPPLLAQN